MKILQSNLNYYSNHPPIITPQLVNKKYCNTIPKNDKDSFSKMKNISFGLIDDDCIETRISKKKFDPINATSKELDNLAEVFHDNDIKHIKEIIEERYTSLAGIFIKFNSEKEKIEKSTNALLSRIQKIKEEKEQAITDKTTLTTKLALKNQNTAENKLRITNEFLIPLEYAKKDNESNIPNGLILYGNATATEKKDFTNWIAQKVRELGSEFKEINCNSNNLNDTLSSIKKALNDAKQYNKFTQNHTIINLKNIDKILTNLNDENAIDFSDHFKTITENASSKNHVTFLITTELPLEDFDSAVIGDQRFEIKANLIEGLTKDEKEKLTQINNRLDYLEKKANEEFDYYDVLFVY